MIKNYFYNDGTDENKYGCGIWHSKCNKCTAAMEAITAKKVYNSAIEILNKSEANSCKRLFINPDSEYGYMSNENIKTRRARTSRSRDWNI